MATVTSRPPGLRGYDAASRESQGQRKRVAIIGDSITRQGYAADYLTDYVGWYPLGWWVHALARMNWCFEVVAVSSLAGRTIGDMVTAFDAEVGALGPFEEIWILPGANDVISELAGATVVSNFNSLITKAKAAARGGIVRVGTTLPFNAEMTSAQKVTLNFLHRGIRDAQASRDIVVVDTYSSLIDWTSLVGAGTASLFSDLVHPNHLGAAEIGKVWAASFADTSIGDRMVGNLVAPIATTKRILTNSYLAGAGGVEDDASAAGDTPTSWRAGLSSGPGTGLVATFATEAATAAIPRAGTRITFSGTVTGGSMKVQLYQTVLASNVTDVVTLGTTKVQASAEIELATLPATFRGVGVIMTMANEAFSASTNVAAITQLAANSANPGFGDGHYRFVSPRVTVPAGTFYLIFAVTATFAAGEASGEMVVRLPLVEIVE